MLSFCRPVSVGSLAPTNSYQVAQYQRGCLSSHQFSVTADLSTLNIANYWARKQRKSEKSDLGSLIHMANFMGSFNKTAFRPKMTVAFATLSHSTRSTPCFLSVPEDFPIAVFHHTTPETCASLCYTQGWDRAPMGFCQWWSSTSWKVVGDWHGTLHAHF